MKKRYCITLIIIGVIILFSIIILSFNNINMNNALELRVPLLAKKEKTKLQNGSIILSHNGTDHTADSLDFLIKNIKNSGYQITTVSDLIYKENYSINNNGTQIKD